VRGAECGGKGEGPARLVADNPPSGRPALILFAWQPEPGAGSTWGNLPAGGTGGPE